MPVEAMEMAAGKEEKAMNWLLKLVLPMIMDVIKEALAEENIQKYGRQLYLLIKKVILDSETKIDDKVVLPIATVFFSSLGIDTSDD